MPDDSQRKSRLRHVEEDQASIAKAPPARKAKRDLSQQGRGFTRSRLQLTEAELGEPRLDKPLRQAEKAAEKLDKAKARIPKRKAIAIVRATDEATGKSSVRLHFEEKLKPPSRLKHNISRLPAGEAHRQIGEAEDENVGLQAAHETEKGAESAARFAKNSSRAQKFKDYRAVEHAQQRLDKASVRVLQKKERLTSNPVSRWRQKQAIKRDYMAAKAAGNTAGAGGAAQGAATAVQQVGQGIKQIFARNKKTLMLGGLLFLMLAMVMNGLSACTSLFQTGMQSIVIATYPAEDADIRAAERAYRNMEDTLADELDNYPSFHPGYDEYEYDLDEIWHDPHALISLISAHMNGEEWTIDNVYGFLEALFKKQYTLTQTVQSETRYRKEWVTHYQKKTDPETGAVTWEPYEVLEDVPYTYRTCSVTLRNFNLSHLPFYVLSRKQVGLYAMYMSVLGNREDIFRGYPHASVLKEYTKHDIPEEYLQDDTFARLMEEAQKYLGYPYVWGGDSPETSFDCSGFVSYVFTNSGVRNVGRLGATSLYGACRKITAEEIRPGDLVFFAGTIPHVPGISHVGIYVGDGWMIHCGSPVGYAELSSAYFQEHFYGYGRLVYE